MRHISFIVAPTPHPHPIPHPASFIGKEKDYESGFHYYGARYYWSETLTGWLSVDPMADKYPGVSPYAYCAWNPVRLVDPDGKEVLPCSDEAYEMILKSIPAEARAYVQRNSDGYIDRDLINSYSCESQNFNELKELVNMVDCTIEVSLVNNYEYINDAGENTPVDMSYSNPEIEAEMAKLYGIKIPLPSVVGVYSPSTGESGEMGISLLPTSTSGKRSTNGNIQVYINEKLSMMGRVENFAHEFFGHAYLYATTRNATIAGHGTETDSNTDSNSELKKRIIRAQNEATSYNR